MTNWDVFYRHAQALPPRTTRQFTSGTTGTFQCGVSGTSTSADLNKLHEITALIDIIIEGGTGAAVTATGGTPVKAGTRYPFVPTTGRESIGWASADGSTAASSTVPVSVAVRSSV